MDAFLSMCWRKLLKVLTTNTPRTWSLPWSVNSWTKRCHTRLPRVESGMVFHVGTVTACFPQLSEDSSLQMQSDTRHYGHIRRCSYLPLTLFARWIDLILIYCNVAFVTQFYSLSIFFPSLIQFTVLMTCRISQSNEPCMFCRICSVLQCSAWSCWWWIAAWSGCTEGCSECYYQLSLWSDVTGKLVFMC